PRGYRRSRRTVRRDGLRCNFAPKQIAGVRSEVLVTGVYDSEDKVVLAGFDKPLPNGARLA
ncbi:tRNA-binding protein, partial [Pseudomonas aeruginosa]